MRQVGTFIRRYPIVAIAVAVGIVAGVLQLAGWPVGAQWLVSGFGLVVAGIQFWGMLRDLRSGHVGIDVLAIIAIVSTILVGEYWATLVIVLMLSGGEALEDFAGRRARTAVRSLLARSPVEAHLVDEHDAITDIPVDEVRVGQTLLVRPSEVVPVDGSLLSDTATMDESSLTGESLPVDVERGGCVLSGSVNGPTAVTIRADAVAADSQYQQVVRLVTEASESRAPIVRLADRYAVPFTVLALVIAAVGWWVSGDPVRFAEVMVVATPCPLLIAAPVAFISGMSRGARDGVIVKSGGTLEQLARIHTVAFDKTGTLTGGTPQVVAVRPANGLSEERLLATVASAEQYSSHVLAASVLEEAERRGIGLVPAHDAREVATNGVEATLDGTRVAVGKRSFVTEQGAEVTAPLPQGGQSAVYASVDGGYAGEVVLADRVRANARDTVQRMRALGVRAFVMVTGDQRPTAEHIASEVGIDDVHADCLPADKVRLVRELPGRPVMMVGDGVNDAPVLASADVGVAMGARGSTAASESADVVVMVDDIGKTARAIEIGRRTTDVALQCIWIGIALSVVLMLVAVFGVIPAIIGALLQEAVDLTTILWALRALTR
ncbi:heavy metal translocating P-type ATPase [Humibacter ginsenosidimutans]|uniref:Heavy metal translocating P-type ATPase n=1 Tax=Humibacter ginsenosidimutans TaxID=2599293 RepID=A0A5B8M5H8_9MICO|nr:heavy metal translocating P-type ATPase [Humibacter ginsenosidimutans]QDZ14842.1 heavy metal translocating P-type ATPase [Humibacter ginsenosidimutans]